MPSEAGAPVGTGGAGSDAVGGYLARIGQVALLSPEAERDLAKRVAAGE